MKIGVIGIGGVGGYFGGLLARGGKNVTFIARGEHLWAIQKNGLKVESAAAGDFAIKVPALERPKPGQNFDLILFCVKTYHNPEAIQTIAPAVGRSSSILTLQNGISSVSELAQAFGAEKVLAGAAYIESSIKAPGVISQTAGPCRIVFGRLTAKSLLGQRGSSQTFKEAGIDVQLSTNVMKELWNKFVFICGLSGMASITRSSMREVLAIPET